MKQLVALLIALTFGAAILESCTKEVFVRRRFTGQIYKIDSNRSWAYPIEFDRARDLRGAEMFTEAAYIYILLYNNWKDSVVNESVRMADEILLIDSNRSVTRYFQEALGQEVMLDPEVKPKEGPLDQKEMKKRMTSSSELMNALNARGYK